jgi:hypothetical protein
MASHSLNTAQEDPTLYYLVEQAILLEKNYKEMFLQVDEVDQRIELWRKALTLCETESERMSYLQYMRARIYALA